MTRFIILFLFLVSPAWAHHDEDIRTDVKHWYDSECCNDKDCRPVGRSFIRWVPGGWLITDTGQIVPELDPNGQPNRMIRRSKDTSNHICRAEGAPNAVCIYLYKEGH